MSCGDTLTEPQGTLGTVDAARAGGRVACAAAGGAAGRAVRGAKPALSGPDDPWSQGRVAQAAREGVRSVGVPSQAGPHPPYCKLSGPRLGETVIIVGARRRARS